MANSPSGGDITDVRKIRRLVELMQEHELTEIDLRDGDIRIRLRKGGDTIVTTHAPMAAYPVAAPAPAASAPAAPAAVAPAADSLPVIKSPMVGTFYKSSSPESPALVKVGDNVGPETPVCIIEAMKVFNEIKSEVSGTVTQILAKNGTAVEFGQKLFLVKPS